MMDIVVDFDGTVVTHDYPLVGNDIGAIPVLKELVAKGHNLILFTMRSGEHLQDAVDWFSARGIDLYGVQTNPTQHQWTDSPKAYGQIIIDDAALGCPLLLDVTVSGRPFVDWIDVRNKLVKMGVI